MTNYEKYVNVFVETFSVSAEQAEKLEYQGIERGIPSAIWD